MPQQLAGNAVANRARGYVAERGCGMTNHTPGPWHQCGAYVYSGAPGAPTVAICSRVGPTSGERYANAHLIAAAPEMVHALGLALRWAREEPMNAAAREMKARDLRQALEVFAYVKGGG